MLRDYDPNRDSAWHYTLIGHASRLTEPDARGNCSCQSWCVYHASPVALYLICYSNPCIGKPDYSEVWMRNYLTAMRTTLRQQMHKRTHAGVEMFGNNSSLQVYVLEGPLRENLRIALPRVLVEYAFLWSPECEI